MATGHIAARAARRARGDAARAAGAAAAGQQLHRPHGDRARDRAPTGGSATRCRRSRRRRRCWTWSSPARPPSLLLFTHEDRPLDRAHLSVEGLDSGVIALRADVRGDAAVRLRRSRIPGRASERSSISASAPRRSSSWRRAASRRFGDARGRRRRQRQPAGAAARDRMRPAPSAVAVGANPSAVAALPGGRFVTADSLSDTLTFVAGGKVAATLDVGAPDRPTPADRGELLFYSRALVPNNVADGPAVALHLRRLPRRRPHRRPPPPRQAQPLLLDDQELPRPGHDGALPLAGRAGDHRRRSPTTSSRRTRRAPSAAPRGSTSTRSRCGCARARGWEHLTSVARGGARGAGRVHGAHPARAVAVRGAGTARARSRASAPGLAPVPRRAAPAATSWSAIPRSVHRVPRARSGAPAAGRARWR